MHPGLMTNNLPAEYEFKPFTREEEYELFIRFREEGDEVAKEQLCLSVMRMVHKQVYTCLQGYRRQTAAELYDEIMSSCMIRLVGCLTAFDYERGVRFSTYVNWAVTNRIRTYFNNRKRDLAREGRSNTGMALKRGNGSRVVARRQMDGCKIGINEDTLSAYHIVDRKADTNVLLDLLQEDITMLDSRTQDMLRLKFIEGKSCKDIATMYNLTKVRIEQIINRGARKVREKSPNRKTYLQAVAC